MFGGAGSLHSPNCVKKLHAMLCYEDNHYAINTSKEKVNTAVMVVNICIEVLLTPGGKYGILEGE